MNKDIIDRVLEALDAASETKLGAKLCDLDEDEKAARADHTTRALAFIERKEALQLEERQLDLEKDVWWAKVKSNHKIIFPRIEVRKDAVYERVSK